jgi:hypothetical protein
MREIFFSGGFYYAGQTGVSKGREDFPLWENARVMEGQRNDARSHRTAA